MRKVALRLSRRTPVVDPNVKNRVPENVERAVVELALENPSLGQKRASDTLRQREIFISAAGVRCVWLRHDLETFNKRLKALEDLSPPETSYQLTSLTLLPRPHTFTGHDNYHRPCPVYPAGSAPKPRPFKPRNPGTSPTTSHGKAHVTQTASIPLARTAVLGLALPPVARLSADTAGFQTGYSGALAPQGLSAVLDLEVPLPPGRAPTHRSQGTRTYLDDVPT